MTFYFANWKWLRWFVGIVITAVFSVFLLGYSNDQDFWGGTLLIFVGAFFTADLVRAVLLWSMDLYFLVRNSHPQVEAQAKLARIVMLAMLFVFGGMAVDGPNYEDQRIPLILWVVAWLTFGLLNAKAEVLSSYPELGPSFRTWPVWRRYRVLSFSGVVFSALSFLTFAPTHVPTVSALVVSGCFPNECEWKKITKEDFNQDKRIWEDCRKSGNYIIINNSGRVLDLEPIHYRVLGQYGNTSTSSIIIRPGVSIQQNRPSYLMKAAPSSIRTRSSSGITTHWQLSCRY